MTSVSLVLLVVFLGSCLNLAASLSISVTPSNDIPVTTISDENITYTCTVDSGRRVLWEIQGTQLFSDSTIEDFAGFGVHIVEGPTAATSLVVITPEARMNYVNESVMEVSIQCNAFSSGPPPVLDEGETFTVIIYGPPDPPGNLRINANPDQLSQIFFTWDRPTNIPEGIEANYTIEITGARNNITTTTSELSFSFMDDELSDCQEHTFSVFSSNPAGSGSPTVTTAVIPISPLVNTINDQFRLSSLRLNANGGGTLEVTFPPATTCGAPFPIRNYTVQAIGFPSLDVTREISDEEQQMNVTVQFPIGSGIQQGEVYFFKVIACISSTCRPSNLFRILTTDVQQSSITFFDNNALLTCTFADEGPTQGCVITLILIDGTERFYLNKPQSGTMATQCNITTSQRDAYERNTSFAADWLGNGMIGTTIIGIMGFEDLATEQEYTEATGCVIPGPPGGLPAGAIVGIVLGIIAGVVIILGIVIVLAVLAYKLRVGRWFKVAKRDGDEFTVDFESSLLMEDKPKRKASSKKSGKVSAGHVTPDAGSEHPEPQFDAIDIRTAAAQLPANLPEESTLFMHSMHSPLSMQAPMQAITLAIKPGEKKVRLHLNKALIRRVLEQNNQLQSLDRRALSGMKPMSSARPPSFKKQDSRPMLSLPLSSAILMLQDEDEQDKGLETIEETEAR